MIETPPRLQIVSTPIGDRATGWVKRPAAVRAFLRQLVKESHQPTFALAAPRLMEVGDANDAYFAWDAEKAILGAVLDSWDQGQVGTCVSFGYGRGSQDLLLNEIAFGQPEKWPGAQIATEPIYGGSRVEVGGGGIGGDGSVGAWAAEWVKDWGLLVRKSYTFAGKTWDLSRYSENTSRQWGDSGVPDALEPEAKLHPVTAVAQVTTVEELWAALSPVARKAVPVCSGQGFSTSRDADGYCRRSGTWNHCMLYRARFVHPKRGRSVVIQNSWGDYLGSANREVQYVKADGSTGTFALPMGCFCVELSVTAEALREQDTFALAGLRGWEADPVPPGPGPGPGPTPPTPPGPMPPITYQLGWIVTENGVKRQLSADVTFPDGSDKTSGTFYATRKAVGKVSHEDAADALVQAWQTSIPEELRSAVNWTNVRAHALQFVIALAMKDSAGAVQALLLLMVDFNLFPKSQES